MKIVAIAAGGAIGAVLRYWISGLTYYWLSPSFPWGTFIVNVSGCFLIGFLSEIFTELFLPQSAKIFLLTGLLGAFTTFSTFALESGNLIRNGQLKYAAINTALSNFVGIILVFFGFFLARTLLNLFK